MKYLSIAASRVQRKDYFFKDRNLGNLNKILPPCVLRWQTLGVNISPIVSMVAQDYNQYIYFLETKIDIHCIESCNSVISVVASYKVAF